MGEKRNDRGEPRSDVDSMEKVIMCLASIAPNAEMTDGTISPTLMARAGTGGGQLPIVVLERNEKGNTA